LDEFPWYGSYLWPVPGKRQHRPLDGGQAGGKSPGYEDWSKKDLQDRARELSIEGRSKMGKGDLVDALRNH